MEPTTRIDENTVEVTSTCCKSPFRLTLTVAQEQAWRGGQLVQRVTPSLSPDERELLISGMCAACWETLFANDGEELEEADVMKLGYDIHP